LPPKYHFSFARKCKFRQKFCHKFRISPISSNFVKSHYFRHDGQFSSFRQFFVKNEILWSLQLSDMLRAIKLWKQRSRPVYRCAICLHVVDCIVDEQRCNYMYARWLCRCSIDRQTATRQQPCTQLRAGSLIVIIARTG